MHFSSGTSGVVLGLGLISTALAVTDDRVSMALTVDAPINGITTTADGRIFGVYQHVEGSTGMQVAEFINGTPVAYPNEAWNSYAAGSDPATTLVHTNAIRIGPDGALWVVDKGEPTGETLVLQPYGSKLVKINVDNNTVDRVYYLGNVSKAEGFIDDVRFNPSSGFAYLTDANAPALVVLDLVSGRGVRVLEDDKTTAGFMPTSGDGSLLRETSGSYHFTQSDQLEVSPDLKWLYYQPCAGGMYRIETKYLDQAFYNSSLASELPNYPEPYATTPSTGGTAIDANGNIYLSDVDRREIIKIAPNGTWTTYVTDERLSWVDAMWIDSSNKLWMPAAQLNYGPNYQNGTNLINYPLHVYTIDIGVGPSPTDHS